MTPDEDSIEAIIHQLEGLTSAETGYFGIWQAGGEQDESIIRANKDGLRLYAIELLKASLKKECVIGKNEIAWLSTDSDVWITNTEVMEETRSEWPRSSATQPSSETTFSEKAFLTGCTGIGILLLAIFIIGLQTLVNWFF